MASGYTVTFKKENPLWNLYQKLKQDGVQDSDLDIGSPKTDYTKKTRTTTGQNDHKIDEQEVLNYALGRYEKYQQVIKETIGYVVPWSLDDLDPKTTFDEDLRTKINGAIVVFRVKLEAQEYKSGTDRYNELLGVSLYAFATASKKKDGVESKIPDDVQKELEAANLKDIVNYLKSNGGLGLIDITNDCTSEATALEALEKGCGWCTEQTNILYPLFKTAGLQVSFIHGIPRHTSGKNQSEPGALHNSLGLILKRGIHHINTAGQHATLRQSDVEAFYRDHFEWWFDQTSGEQLAGYYYNLGAEYLKSGKLDLAIEESKKAVQINPKDTEAHANLGAVYLKNGELGLATEEFKKAIQINPKNIEAHVNLGAIYLKNDKLDLAIKESKMALQIDPNNAKAHSNLGVAYAKSGKVDLAIKEFQKAVQSDPTNVEAHFNLAILCFEKGNQVAHRKQALEMYRKALESLQEVSKLGLPLPAQMRRLEEDIGEHMRQR